MKKLLLVLAVAGFATACNNDSEKKSEEKKDSVVNVIDSTAGAMKDSAVQHIDSAASAAKDTVKTKM
jgi:hypothetical protein